MTLLNWQDPGSVKNNSGGDPVRSGYHSGVVKASGTEGIIFWLETLAATYGSSAQVKMRARTVSLDGLNTLGTPFDVGWTSTGNYSPEPEYWHTYRLSDGRIVMHFYLWGIGSKEFVCLLLSPTGTLLDADVYVRGGGTSMSVGPSALSPSDVLFVGGYTEVGSDYAILAFTFAADTIVKTETNLGTGSGIQPYGVMVADATHVAVMNEYSLGTYRSWAHSGGATLTSPSGQQPLSAAAAGYTGKTYAVEDNSLMEAFPAPGGGWYVVGYVVDEDGSGNEWPSIARITMTGGVVAVQEVRKWDQPAGSAQPYVRFYNNAPNSHHLYTYAYTGPLRPFAATMIGSKPTAIYPRRDPTASYVDVAVQKFTSLSATTSDLSESFSYQIASPLAVPDLDADYAYLGFLPLVGNYGMVLVGMWGENGLVAPDSEFNIGFMRWLANDPVVPPPIPDSTQVYVAPMDALGNFSMSGKVRVLKPGTDTLVSVPIYKDRGLTEQITPEFIAEPAVTQIWAAEPMRVDIKVESYDLGAFRFNGVDFQPAPEDALHAPTGGSEVIAESTSTALSYIADDEPVAFSPLDVTEAHEHTGRSKGTVGIDSIPPGPGSPIIRQVVRGGTFGTNTVASTTDTFPPDDAPQSVYFSPGITPTPFSADNGLREWPLDPDGAAESYIDQYGHTMHWRRFADPGGVGRSVAIGYIVYLWGSNHVALGSILEQPDYLFLPDDFDFRSVSIGTRNYANRGSVLIGSYLSGLGTNYQPSTEYHGIDLGYLTQEQARALNDGKMIRIGWGPSGGNAPEDNQGSIVVGSGSLYAYDPWITGAFDSDNRIIRDNIILGRFNTHFPGTAVPDGEQVLWQNLWGSLTAITPHAHVPADAPDWNSIVPTLTPIPGTIYTNDSWAYWKVYNQKIAEMPGEYRLAHFAALAAVSNTGVYRAVDLMPSGGNFKRVSWMANGLAAHNLYSVMPPVSDRARPTNGVMLLSHPGQARVPGTLVIDGDATLGAPVHDGIGAAGKIGFYGATAVVRPQVDDDASIPALTSLLSALASLGLVVGTGSTLVSDTLQRVSALLDSADTGQGPVGYEPLYGTVAATTTGAKRQRLNTSSAVNATAANYTWQPVLYYTDQADVVVEGTFTTWGTADDGLLVRAKPNDADFQSSFGRNFEYALLAGKTALWQRNPDGTKTSLVTYSSDAVDGDTLQVSVVGTSVTVKVNGATRATHTLPGVSGGLLHGFALDATSVMKDLTIKVP